jgi:hypothetical protein
MSRKKSAALTRRTAMAGFGGGLLAPGLASQVQAAVSVEAAPVATDSAHAVAPKGLLFANPIFHFETLRNAGYIVSNCVDMGEILETMKAISEGDTQSWYSAWQATADRVLAPAEGTQDSGSGGVLSKFRRGGA